MRDVNYGWMIRYIHANVASFFFIFVYLHIGRGLYYGSYKSPRAITWSIGVIILVLMMAIAFLGYVLPYGQMSLWGATVITNMLSAIPWIGQDFVEFLLNHIVFVLFVASSLLTATAIYSALSDPLPQIGVINWGKLRGAKPLTDEAKQKLLSIPYDFLAMLVGLIDGDGYLPVIKTNQKGNIKCEMVLSLDIKELPLLLHIQEVLGFGRVNEYPNIGCAKLIFSKLDLQQAFLPLLIHHNLFFITTTRRQQLDKLMYVLTNNVTYFHNIPAIIPVTSYCPFPTTAAEFLSLPFFANWTVGFTVAEGSFYTKASGEYFFSLRQRAASHTELFEAFKLLFNTTTQIENDGEHLKFAVSSVRDLERVVEFFSFSGNHPLVGLKLLQYQSWIANMKSVKRFNGLRLP